YVPEPGNYHRFDCWAQNDMPYGFTTVRIEYKGATSNPDVPTIPIEPGLLLDYIDFIPYD
ncbi:MAG TPA: hypothetical protein VE870_16545, partial [Bacteroidales bacterium]|nr:hypothetical protein [Bacteroidales bacterium]